MECKDCLQFEQMIKEAVAGVVDRDNPTPPVGVDLATANLRAAEAERRAQSSKDYLARLREEYEEHKALRHSGA